MMGYCATDQIERFVHDPVQAGDPVGGLDLMRSGTVPLRTTGSDRSLKCQEFFPVLSYNSATEQRPRGAVHYENLRLSLMSAVW